MSIAFAPSAARRALAPLALVLALAAGSAACSGNAAAPKPPSSAPPAAGSPAPAPAAAKTEPAEPAAPGAASAEPDEVTVGEAAEPADTAPVLAPPDGVWLKDDAGREYFVDTLPKVEGTYRRLDDKTVRTRWGIPIEVLREDDELFYFKVYKPEQQQPTLRRAAAPTPEELEAAAKSYVGEAGESRRLSFVPFSQGLPTGGQWRNGFAVADMNGDGLLDVVHGSPRKTRNPPAIFLGDGKGGWKRWAEARFPSLAYDYGDVATADFNGDGHQDLALAVHLHGLIALVGDGKGNFQDWSKGLDFQVPGMGNDASGYSSRTLLTVDWNRDGRPDILALGEGPRLNTTNPRSEGGMAAGGAASYGPVVYLNQGNGSWVRKDQGTGGGQPFGDALTLGDFDGDGRTDFATASNTFGRRDILHLAREDGSWSAVEIPGLRPQGYIRGLATADFDGDRRDDLAVGYVNRELGVWRSGIDVFLARPEGRWERRALQAVAGRSGVTAAAAGDLDGDGHADVVALTGAGDTWVFLGDGKGGFAREGLALPKLKGDCRGYHAAIADFDGDGRGELVAAFAGEGSPLLAPGRCPSGGAIEAWHFGPATPAR